MLKTVSFGRLCSQIDQLVIFVLVAPPHPITRAKASSPGAWLSPGVGLSPGAGLSPGGVLPPGGGLTLDMSTRYREGLFPSFGGRPQAVIKHAQNGQFRTTLLPNRPTGHFRTGGSTVLDARGSFKALRRPAPLWWTHVVLSRL